MESQIRAAYDAASRMVALMRQASHFRNHPTAIPDRPYDGISDPSAVAAEDAELLNRRNLYAAETLTHLADEIQSLQHDLRKLHEPFDPLWDYLPRRSLEIDGRFVRVEGLLVHSRAASLPGWMRQVAALLENPKSEGVGGRENLQLADLLGQCPVDGRCFSQVETAIHNERAELLRLVAEKSTREMLLRKLEVDSVDPEIERIVSHIAKDRALSNLPTKDPKRRKAYDNHRKAMDKEKYPEALRIYESRNS